MKLLKETPTYLARYILSVLQEIGQFASFILEVAKTTSRTRGNLGKIMEQVAEVSYRSLPTVAFAGVFIGAILVLQFNTILAKYDAQVFLGGLNSSALIREVGPLIISFMLAGKIGAYTAAELGTMRVTEQIDAIECLGTHPIQYLIVPRFVGIILSSLILLAIGLMVSIAGSMGVASALCGMNPLQYVSTIPRFTGIAALTGGMFRSLVYGTIVASVSCYEGYTAKGGASGVGRAVTRAAIFTNLYIVIANFLTSTFLDAVAVLWEGFHEILSSKGLV